MAEKMNHSSKHSVCVSSRNTPESFNNSEKLIFSQAPHANRNNTKVSFWTSKKSCSCCWYYDRGRATNVKSSPLKNAWDASLFHLVSCCVFDETSQKISFLAKLGRSLSLVESHLSNSIYLTSPCLWRHTLTTETEFMEEQEEIVDSFQI